MNDESLKFLEEEYQEMLKELKPFKNWLTEKYILLVEDYLAQFPAKTFTKDHLQNLEAEKHEKLVAMALETFLYERFVALLKTIEPTSLFVKSAMAYASQLADFAISETENKLESDLKLTEIIASSMRNLKENKNIN